MMLGNSLSLIDQSALGLAVAASVVTVSAIVANRNRIADATGLVDDAAVKDHANHDGRVPLVGGLAWVSGAFVFVAAFTLLAMFSGGLGTLGVFYPVLLAFLGFIGLFFILGLIDDIHALTPRIRLAASAMFVAMLLLLTGGTFMLEGVSDAFLSIDVEFGNLSAVATAFAIVALVNAVNMADGRNGVVAGIAVIWSVTLLIHSENAYLSAFLAASVINCLVLWRSNGKGHLFFGDAGTYAIASAFAAVALFWHSHDIGGAQLTSLQVCSLFIILVADMMRLMIDRVRAGRSPMGADHDHLHHRLDRHFGWKTGLPIYLALVALPIIVAFQPFAAAGVLGLMMGLAAYAGVILLTNPSRIKLPAAPGMPRDNATL
jgi:UDP-GlcNAc:undecaprenyl-phosphate/decaprenyl-phosphate GlcNAc-1-phosphate transferase